MEDTFYRVDNSADCFETLAEAEAAAKKQVVRNSKLDMIYGGVCGQMYGVQKPDDLVYVYQAIKAFREPMPTVEEVTVGVQAPAETTSIPAA